MNRFFRSTLQAALATTLAIGAGASQARLDSAASAQLEALRQSPDTAGTLIYRGAVFAQRATAAEPLFHYERRVGTTPGGLSSSHITQDPQGDVIIAEQAHVSTRYALQRFDAVNRQMGYSGSVVVSADGRRLDYRLDDNGKVTTATEEVSDPVVSGPSLHGFILQHWDALTAGKRIAVRMIVMTKKATYGFDIRHEGQANGQTAFSITPSSLLVRLAVAPLRVVFDSTTHHVVRYEGRVPPMESVAGKLKELDARVDYTMMVQGYR
jgi:hypothetical protein